MVIRYKKLIFVDTNDNCRAPMAEMILKRKFLTNPLTIESRGMVVLFPERSKKCKNKTAAPVFQRDSSYSACRYSKSSSVTPKYFSAKSTRSTRNSFPRRYSSAPASVGNSKRSL